MAKLSWKTEQRFVKDLMIAEINPRKISQEQKEALTRSLEKFNLADIPVLNTDNTIISGNQRLQILYDLGKGNDEIDVRVPNRKLSESELKEYMLIANTHAGVFDVEILEAHFEDVNIDFDIQLVDENGKITVKSHERVKEGLTDPDEVPEPPKIPKSKPGQIFILGMHRLMCGDSTKKEDVELLMAGKKADLVVTDPPYNVAVNDESKESLGKRNRRTDGLKIMNDKMSDFDFDDFLKKIFENYYENINDGASIYVFYADSMTIPFLSNFINSGFHFAQNCIWNKQQFVMTRKDYHSKHEPCIYGWKKDKAHNWYSDRKQSSVWDFDRPFRNELHPTMKPIELIEYPIGNSSKKKDIVLDLFSGSGSGMIACEKMGRSFYGMELDPIYIDVIIKRWQDFTGQKAILEATGQEFDSL